LAEVAGTEIVTVEDTDGGNTEKAARQLGYK